MYKAVKTNKLTRNNQLVY